MFVQVDLLYGESEQGALVPASALWEDPATGQLTAWVAASRDGDATRAQVVRREISVLAEGRAAAAVRGVRPGERVVVIGQHLFEGNSGEARVRATTWERVTELETKQREDVLEEYLARQQRLANSIGSRPYTNEEFLGEAARGEAGPVEEGAGDV